MSLTKTYKEKINNLRNEIEKYLNKETNEIIIFNSTIDILYINNLLKINFFSLGIRELIRFFLSNNSQDEDIKQCIWYSDYITYNALGKEVITRKQRMIYSIYGGLNLIEIKQKLGIDIEDKIKQLLDVVDELSCFSHIEDNIIENEVTIMEKSIQILVTFKEFLEKLTNFKNDFAFKYEKYISEIMIDKFTNEAIEELDNKATHYENPYFVSNDIKLLNLNSNKIHLLITGTTNVTLQYGSDYDNRVGDGIRTNKDYLTTFNITFNTEDAFNLNISNIEIENLQIIDDYDNM